MNGLNATPNPCYPGTGTIGPCDAPTPSAFTQAGTHLEGAQGELQVLLNELEARLAPILSPPTPADKANIARPPFAAPLAEWIEQRAQQADVAIALLRSLHSRIQL